MMAVIGEDVVDNYSLVLQIRILVHLTLRYHLVIDCLSEVLTVVAQVRLA